MEAESFHALSRAEWRDWLKKNHKRERGIWLVTYKKFTGKPRLEYAEAVEEALCFGWVDSKPGVVDEERSRLWMAPRKAGSAWSKLNKERVARLIAEKRMTAAGLEKIEAAKKDGAWDRLNEVEALMVPPDLGLELAARKPAEEYFAAFPRSVKRGILEWIEQAKRAETRAARIAETARLAQRNERANQWKR
jgi:uncharacterized protein YdeI (YjbR/CyaY-like superfamily)